MKDYKLVDLAKRWYIFAAVGIACYSFTLLVLRANVSTMGNELFVTEALLGGEHRPVLPGYDSNTEPHPAVLSSDNPRLRNSGSKLYNFVVLKFVLDGLVSVVLLPFIVIGFSGYCLDLLYRRLCKRKQETA
jgi:hypothetical protein